LEFGFVYLYNYTSSITIDNSNYIVYNYFGRHEITMKEGGA